MKRETFTICIDDDNVDILDWIRNHFANGNSHKHFEVEVTVREIDYGEDGKPFYVEDEDWF